MSFLNSQAVLGLLERNTLVRPWSKERIRHGAYELGVGDQYYCTSMNQGRQTVPEGGQIVIPPGQLALLLSEEEVEIPPPLIGFISIKFSSKIRGLINVSGFHVDPGFKGRLKFSVYNAGSREAIFDPGEPLFCIWFARLTKPENEPYDGSHQNQIEITAHDVSSLQGTIASPGALLSRMDGDKRNLDARLDKLANKVAFLRWLVAVMGTVMAAALITLWIR